jgi:transposase
VSTETGELQTPEQFGFLVQRWPDVRVAFEASMNWHWLYEVLERSMPGSHITLANPFKTRIIAEAQVKTDKVDARILALLLRAELICAVHIPARETRQRKEVLRQRCFLVRQRTMLRNRIHRLLGGPARSEAASGVRSIRQEGDELPGRA